MTAMIDRVRQSPVPWSVFVRRRQRFCFVSSSSRPSVLRTARRPRVLSRYRVTCDARLSPKTRSTVSSAAARTRREERPRGIWTSVRTRGVFSLSLFRFTLRILLHERSTSSSRCPSVWFMTSFFDTTRPQGFKTREMSNKDYLRILNAER